MDYQFCPACAGAIEYRVPEQDERPRAICSQCGMVHYQNPRIVVGAVAFWQERVLLCRRAIAPRIGYWALPAGYLELGESTEAGALREAWEEAQAELNLRQLLAVYNLVHINQVQILYLAELKQPNIYPGPESQQVGLFSLSEIPWQELAFPTVQHALRHAWQMRKEDRGPDLRSQQLELNPDLLY